jgi:anti-anti-sigma factor
MPFIEFDTVNHWLIAKFRCVRLTDPATITAVGSDLQSRLHKLPVRGRVCVSFDGVEFVSSQIIGLMLSVQDAVARKHGELVLCDVGEHIESVLKLTKLNGLFDVRGSVADVIGKRKRIARTNNGSIGDDWLD